MSISHRLQKATKLYCREVQIKQQSAIRLFVVAAVAMFFATGLIGVLLYVAFTPGVSLNIVKLFLFASMFGYLVFGFAATHLKLSKSNISDAKFWLDPRIYFVSAFIVYFGLSALELNEYEIRAEVIQYWYFTISLVFFIAGTLVVRRKPAFVAQQRSEVMDFRRLTMASLVVGVFIVGVVGLYKIWIFGLPMFSESVQETRGQMVSNIGGYYYYLAFAFSDVIILILLYRIVARRSLFIHSLLDFVIVGMALFALVSLGSRTRAIYPLLIVFVFFILYRNSKVSFKWVLSGGVVVSFLIGLGAYRYSLDAGTGYAEALIHTLFGEMNLASSTLGRLIAFFPEKIDYLGAYTLAMPLLSVLPGSQVVLTSYLKDVLNLPLTGSGFTPTLVGGFFVTGGWSAVAVGMFLYGFALRSVFVDAIRNKSPGKILFYAYLVVYSLNSMKGGFLKDVEPIFHGVILYTVYQLSVIRLGARQLATK